MPITVNGFEALRASDFLATIREDFEAFVAAEFGETVDWAEDVVLAELTAIMAQRLGAISEAAQAVYDSTDPAAAQGVQLSTQAAMVGVLRNAATASTVTLTLSGTAGTLVPSGKVVQGGGANGAAQWRTTADATIGSGGTVTVAAECTETGPVEADGGDITTIVSPVVGWSSVTNAAAATTGTATESDAALRLRRATRLRASTGRSLEAIRTALLDLDYLEGALVIDNPSEEAATVRGIALPGCSYLAVLYPAPATTERQREVLTLLYDYAPFGIEPAGTDVTGEVAGSDGNPKAVGYDVATSVTVDITFTVTMATGYDATDAIEALTDAIEAFLLTLRPGDPVYGLQLLGLASDIGGILDAAVTIDGGTSYSPSATQVVRGNISGSEA